MAIPIERCPTGIGGFDKLCQGGLVRNNVSTVVGGPGSGKTVFLLQFLWNGLQQGENGIYVSLESDLADVIQDAYAFGWDFSKYDAEGKCKFLRFSPTTAEREMEKMLMEAIAKYDVKRVCFDPVSVFAMALEKESAVRQAIYNLCSLLKRLKVTVLLSEEVHGEASMDISAGEKLSRYGVVEFLVDGVITLHSIGLGGATDRAIRIVKMRRTNHVRGPVPMQITDNGVVILPEA